MLNPVLNVALALGAAILECAASYLLFDFTQSTTHVALFLVLHAAASAMVSPLLLLMLPAKYRHPIPMVLSLLFSFAFFVPLLGIFGLLLAVFVNMLLPRAVLWRPFRDVAPPEYVLSIREPEAQLRMSSLKSILLDETLPAGLRMRSMNALQNMPTRTVAATLRKLLGDPMDELRLIAYGMLDAKEKAISANIQAEREALKRIAAPGARLNALRHLAELNWELVYSGLVQGDVRTYTLEQALRNVDGALELAPRDPGLWFLKARVLQSCHRVANAAEGFSTAVSCGLPEERALPYLAEIAFEQHDFGALRKYIDAIADTQSTTAMGPIIRFWRRDAPA